ncbi:MAG: hypothetical protein COB15_15160, partial [Flavobacteriales bacterium]
VELGSQLKVNLRYFNLHSLFFLFLKSFRTGLILELHLEEKNQLPNGYISEEYESKGFYPSKRVQDFPVRGKALYLCIKRRVWRKKDNPKLTIKSDYSFISEGSKLTKEISDFLKGTGRDPSRYDK